MSLDGLVVTLGPEYACYKKKSEEIFEGSNQNMTNRILG